MSDVTKFVYYDKNGDPVDLTLLVDSLSVSTGAMSYDNTYAGMTGASNTFQGVGSYTDWSLTTAKPNCDHVMGDETETVDGQVVGFCTICGDKIRGRRMVGGYGLARLKDAIVDALGDREAMAGLIDEIDRVELMLRVEEQALQSAHDMVKMAREMVEKIVLPEKEDVEDAA